MLQNVIWGFFGAPINFALGQEKEISWFSSSADPFFNTIKKKSSRNEDKEIEEKLGFNPVFEFLKSAQK